MLDVPGVLGTAGVELEQDQVDRAENRDLHSQEGPLLSPLDRFPLPLVFADDNIEGKLGGRLESHDPRERIVGIPFAHLDADPFRGEDIPHPGLEAGPVDGEEVDAPAGTLVYLDDPAQKRHAVANEAGTTVLAIGGVPGKHEISAWEYWFPALPLIRAGDYDAARRMLEGALQEKEGPVMHYQLACLEALAGNRERALTELAVAIEGGERFRTYAASDEDFASIRDDPRFPA